MPKKLKRLKIERVDLVDKGANPEAHIVFFKREVELSATEQLMALAKRQGIERAAAEHPDLYRRYVQEVRYGATQPVNKADVMGEITHMVSQAMTTNPGITRDAALQEIFQNNPALYRRYVASVRVQGGAA